MKGPAIEYVPHRLDPRAYPLPMYLQLTTIIFQENASPPFFIRLRKIIHTIDILISYQYKIEKLDYLYILRGLRETLKC